MIIRKQKREKKAALVYDQALRDATGDIMHERLNFNDEARDNSPRSLGTQKFTADDGSVYWTATVKDPKTGDFSYLIMTEYLTIIILLIIDYYVLVSHSHADYIFRYSI